MRILGIDPGSFRTGYGIIDTKNGDLLLCRFGVIDAGKCDLPVRLKKIFTELDNIIRREKPAHIALENVFYAKNVSSTIKMGEARGVAILAASKSRAKIFDYAPAQIKKAVTGNGRASKSQVKAMVQAILNLKPREHIGFDATDALAVAICHSNRIDNYE